MKLIIGLGNPGKQYKNTRHNLGFLIIDQILGELSLSLNQKKFNGEFVKTKINNEDVIIAKPLTFMNLSGQFVVEIVNYYKISFKDLLILVDDKDRGVEKYKLVNKGSSAGQKGIKDIIEKLGTDKFIRLKGGIGDKKMNTHTASYVLKKFSREQIKIVKKLLPRYSLIAQDFLKLSFDELTNKYNGEK